MSKRESFVASQTAIASVSLPSGRSSAVAGSSFITSTNTSSAAVTMPGPEQRQVHVGEHAVRSAPRLWAASSSAGSSRAMRASTAKYASAWKRTM